MNDRRIVTGRFLIRRPVTMATVLLLLMLAAPWLRAQPYAKMYGIGDSEFVRSAWIAATPSQGVEHLWDFARWVHVNILLFDARGRLDSLGALANSPLRDPDQRLMVKGLDYCYRSGWAREIQFFPFTSLDTSQTSYYVCKFYNRIGGVTDTNSFERDTIKREPLKEQVYSTATGDSAGEKVCSNICYNWKATQTSRWKYDTATGLDIDDSLFQSSDALTRDDQIRSDNVNDSFYVVVKGHLFNGGTALNGDSLLKIEVVLEVPKDTQYVANGGIISVDHSANHEFVYQTLWVSKDSLTPVGFPPNFNAYRELSLLVNLHHNDSGMGGPVHPSSRTKRFDIRVYWTGKEKLALRSVAIRDRIGELMLGNQAASVTHRRLLLEEVRSAVYGSPTPAPIDTPRAAIISILNGVEQAPWEFAGYTAVERLLRDSIRQGFAVGDSLHGHTEIISDVIHQLAPTDAIYAEYNISAPVDSFTKYMGDHYDQLGELQKAHMLNTIQLPSLDYHNGGRFQIPKLDLNADSIENSYESALQFARLGQSDTIDMAWPWSWTAAHDLGHAARISQREHKRLILTPFCAGALYVRYIDSLHILDTVLYRQPEAAELRAMVNLGLAYGGRGVHWFWIGNYTNAARFDTTHSAWTFGNDSWGPMGPDVDTTTNFSSSFPITDPGGTTRITIPDFYLGYGNHAKEIMKIDRWLGIIGPELIKLRWRDAYSIHWQVRPAHVTDSTSKITPPRSLPSGEIVTGITARKPGSPTLDPPGRTFVELGLFETKLGYDSGTSTVNHRYDTNYIFVVNRRCFERFEDTTSGSAGGHAMDSLAESREIAITWNAPDPGADQYPFVRVHEIAADTTRLPGATAPRVPLDTIVGFDGTTMITLRPGGGALLEVTYVPFDSTNFSGELRFNSQRKIAFDGNRFHLTYNHRYRFHDSANIFHPYDSTEGVFYRRSVPVTRSTGSVMWEPWEYMVNDTTNSNVVMAFDNVFPSLAIRLSNDSVMNTSGEAIVTIVWSGHEIPLTGDRIYLRKIRSNSSVTLAQPIDTVGFANGADSTLWGTPVVSTLAGGDLVAWSSSGEGIIARLRKKGTWNAAGTGNYTSADSISKRDPGGVGLDAHYPTMPASAHIRSIDSNVGIAWQQNLPYDYDGVIQVSMIRYARVTDSSYVKAGPPPKIIDTLKNQNYKQLSTESIAATHPSMDLWQDVYRQVYEGVTWNDNAVVSYYDTLLHAFKWVFEPWVHFRSLFTETRRGTTAHDSIEGTQFWGLAKLRLQDSAYFDDPKYSYPNTASLNQIYAVTDMPDTSHHDSTYFSVAFYDSTRYAMRQATIEFAHTSFKDGFPRGYSYGDLHPNGSASPVKQEGRHNVVYQSDGSPGATRIRSTRQFFAKERPVGYVADGREVVIPISVVPSAGITGMLHDVWYAGASRAGAAEMTGRGVTSVRIDSLPQALDLMRTGFFHAHDSTTIGCELRGRYYGDSTLGTGAQADFIAELVDSATGAAVATLDSFRVTVADPFYGRKLEKECDLLSGTYYVRMRVATSGVPDLTIEDDSRYPVAELASWVDAPHPGKLRRIDAESGAAGRLSITPNPIQSGAEVLFSVPEHGYASVTLYDAKGGEAMRPVERMMMDAGRYAVEIDASSLTPGAYLLELRYGTKRLVRKFVVIR